MITTEQLQNVIGSDATAPDGSKIGAIGQIYLDNATGEPEWATVRIGVVGATESFVPLTDAHLRGGTVVLPYDEDKVKNAPSVDVDRELSEQEEEQLYAYYGIPTTASVQAPPINRGEQDVVQDVVQDGEQDVAQDVEQTLGDRGRFAEDERAHAVNKPPAVPGTYPDDIAVTTARTTDADVILGAAASDSNGPPSDAARSARLRRYVAGGSR